MYDADQIANLEAELEALVDPTTQDVLAVADDYETSIVAASAARRALVGGNGGGATVTDGNISVAASTIQFPSGTVTDEGGGTASVVVTKLLKSPLITNNDVPSVDLFSVAGGHLAVGDVIIDIWLDVLEFFDGPDNAVANLYAASGGQQYALFNSAPDLAFDRVEDNINGNTPGLGSCDKGGGFSLGVARNTAGSSFPRILPAAVTASDLDIFLILTAGTVWTQGQMHVYALVATPT